jgi:hypothetical protein
MTTHITKTWFDGEKVVTQEIPESEVYKQEPVALETVYETIIHWDEGGGKRSRRELARRIVALYITPPAAQPAPEQYTAPEQALARLQKRYGELEAKVAAQRQWVGLTDEEVIKCTPTWGGTVEDVARAVEAKLKEKNT